jgi:hypothetical protein
VWWRGALRADRRPRRPGFRCRVQAVGGQEAAPRVSDAVDTDKGQFLASGTEPSPRNVQIAGQRLQPLVPRQHHQSITELVCRVTFLSLGRQSSRQQSAEVEALYPQGVDETSPAELSVARSNSRRKNLLAATWASSGRRCSASDSTDSGSGDNAFITTSESDKEPATRRSRCTASHRTRISRSGHLDLLLGIVAARIRTPWTVDSRSSTSIAPERLRVSAMRC